MDTNEMADKLLAFLQSGDKNGPKPKNMEGLATTMAGSLILEVTGSDCSIAVSLAEVHGDYITSVINSAMLCSYQAGIEDTRLSGVEGYEAGLSQGRTDAWYEGIEDGYLRGMRAMGFDVAERTEEAYANGYKAGNTEGTQSGYEHGLKDGRDENSYVKGYEYGRDEGEGLTIERLERKAQVAFAEGYEVGFQIGSVG